MLHHFSKAENNGKLSLYTHLIFYLKGTKIYTIWCNGMKCTNENLIADKKADKFSKLDKWQKKLAPMSVSFKPQVSQICQHLPRKWAN